VSDYLTESSKKTATEAITAGKIESTIEIEFLNRSGVPVSIEVRLVKSPVVDGEIAYYGVARDITERKKAETKLAAYQNQLKSLASQLMLTEARERQKIATLIHDRISQSLSLSRIKLGMLSSQELPQEGEKIVGEINKVIDQMIQESRSLTFAISSPLLYDLGLGAALEQLVEQFHDEQPIDFSFRGVDYAPKIDTDVALFLFDAVKELLVNAVKHSKADSVVVSLENGEKGVEILVNDDGCGFDESANDNGRKRSGGFGLFSIKERLSHIGGSCMIRSGSGGTEVRLAVPAASLNKTTADGGRIEG
jgi:signal transduction histidine kinase